MVEIVPNANINNDYIYDISSVEKILRISDSTVRRAFKMKKLKRIHERRLGDSYPRAYVSARSVAEFAESENGILLNYEELVNLTPDSHKTVLQYFESFSPVVPVKPMSEVKELKQELPVNQSTGPVNDSQLTSFMREQIEIFRKMADDARNDYKDLSEKTTQDIKELAGREAEAKQRLNDFSKELRRMIQSHNRDILRMKAGELNSSMIPLLPLPSLQNQGDLELPEDYNIEINTDKTVNIVDLEEEKIKEDEKEEEVKEKKVDKKKKKKIEKVIIEKPKEKKRGFWGSLFGKK